MGCVEHTCAQRECAATPKAPFCFFEADAFEADAMGVSALRFFELLALDAPADAAGVERTAG